MVRSINFVTLDQAYEEALNLVEKRASGQIKPIKTAWAKFNSVIGGGLVPNTTYVIGGRPGVGKSAFSNRMIFSAYNYAESIKIPISILYWNLEMPNWNQILRELSHKMQISIKDMLSVEKTLAEEHINKIKELKYIFSGKEFFMTTQAVTAKEMLEYGIKFRQSRPNHFLINLFDHTRLAQTAAEESKEEEKIFNLLSAGRKLAVEYDFCNIFLSQLNRNIESEARILNPVPILSDFFGSDSVGQFGNICMILQRPELYNIKTYCSLPSKGLLMNHVLKNRDGDPGLVPFQHNLAINSITSYPLAVA